MTEDHGTDGTGPKNAVVILLDSLNRHMLGAYGGEEFQTPNLDRIGARSTKFTKHYVGSLPCMPARHDILCGAWDFLWRPWGSIELWEDAITYELSKAGVTSQLISDHPHLFETGGENYHVDFSAWDYQRGHEGDLWKTRPDTSWAGAPNFGRKHMPYDDSRGYFKGEEEFPAPRTMQSAASWLEDNAGYHDRFFLFVDEFDPHEPFDTPEPYASMYDPDWEGAHMIWPPYMKGALQRHGYAERQAQQSAERMHQRGINRPFIGSGGVGFGQDSIGNYRSHKIAGAENGYHHKQHIFQCIAAAGPERGQTAHKQQAGGAG